MTEPTAAPSPDSGSLKAWRVQFDGWMALAYAETRGQARADVVSWYGLHPESFLAARVYRVPQIDSLARLNERGVEESHAVWETAGFNPYLDPVNRP